MRRRLLHILIAIDQLAYVLVTLGGGYPDETLSAAAYRTEAQGKPLGRFWRPVIDWLFSPFEREHCKKAYWAERKRLQSPPEQR